MWYNATVYVVSVWGCFSACLFSAAIDNAVVDPVMGTGGEGEDHISGGIAAFCHYIALSKLGPCMMHKIRSLVVFLHVSIRYRVCNSTVTLQSLTD
jgi:hypothetical protein